MSWLLRLLLALLTLPLQSTLLATQKAPNEETPAVAVIHGRVTSGFYGPLYDIAVILIDPDTPNQETVAAHTDADGFYTVTEAISNTWKIKFDPASSQFNAVMLPGYYKNALSLEEATPVT